MPWFIGGDFNEVLNDGEKVGGNNRVPWQMTGFNSALMNCDLMDLGFEGYPFTWSNVPAHPNTVRCRLDRVCANPEALSLFPSAHVLHLDQPGSDYLPIMLHLERLNQERAGRGSRPFRFEALWVRKWECKEIVQRVWDTVEGSGSAIDVMYKGEQCKAELLLWSKNSNPNKEIGKTHSRLMELRKGVQRETVRAEIMKLTAELENLLQDQAMYWRQRENAA